MEEPLETKQCSMCEKPIDSTKFRMHEMGCLRQNYKCRDCGMCVPKSEKEEHEEEEHTSLTCQHCGFSAMKFKYGVHDDNCNKKPKSCEFCEKEVSFNEWHAHLELCGTKTQKCSKCEDFVKMMDKKVHDSTNQCQNSLERKQREKQEKDDQEQKKRLEEFQKERERDIKKQKEAEEKRKQEEMIKERKREERDRNYEQMHGMGDDQNEFNNFDQARSSQQRSSQRQSHPAINSRQPMRQPQMAPMPPSYSNKQGASRGLISQNKKEENKLPEPSGNGRNRPAMIVNNRAKPASFAGSRGIGKATKSNASAVNNSRLNQPSSISGNKRPQQPVSSIPSRSKPNPSVPAHQGSRPQHKTEYAKIRQPLDGSSKVNKPIPKQDVLDDYDQMIFNQFLDEDQDEQLAKQLQNEAFGGGDQFGANPGAVDQQMDDGLGVRQADSEQYGQLIGGEDEMPQRQQQRRSNRQRDVNQYAHDEIMDDWGGGQQQQQHQQHQLNPPSNAGYAAQQNQVASGEEDEQAMMNRIIEESLAQSHGQNQNQLTEDEELARIMEMSKNQM